MKIGLIDVDSHNWPNLAIMKLSAYHRARGDNVSWVWSFVEHFDLVYKSRVFDDTYTQEEPTFPNADKVICGGTGYDLTNRLPDEVEHICPDYSIYPQYQHAYGFLTRGCPRGCHFCIVGEKEGRRSVQVAQPDEFLRGQKILKLLDPNLLACGDHERILQDLAGCGARVDFTQGLDARLLNPDNVQLLRAVKMKRLHLAWDREEDSDAVLRGITLLTAGGLRPWRFIVYVLTGYDTTLEFDLHRVYTLRRLGINPYIMIYNKPQASRVLKDLQGCVNNRWIWARCDTFEKYERR